MTLLLLRRLSAILIALVLCALASGAHSSIAPLTGSHAEELECGDCHAFVPGSDQLPSHTVDCSECHDPQMNIHPIGTTPKFKVPEGFALSEEGTIMCRTCHKLHGGDVGSQFLNEAGNGYVDGRASFCSNCHGAGNVRTNPHSAKRGDTRCTFCHQQVPTDSEMAKKTVRMEVVRLCNFCHGATEKNHPRNIDPDLEIPEGLPLDAQGNWSCVTCHDPHGTVATTHYIRPVFARDLEEDKGVNPHTADFETCGGCHSESTEESIRLPGNSLRFRGDITVLCISCHITDKGHHPTGLELPDAMAVRLVQSQTPLPFDEYGQITCNTCHDNRCNEGDHTMTVRYYDATTYDTGLCWKCHDRSAYARGNPHTPNPKTCTTCHDGRPVEGVSASLSAVPLMVCLHCHEVEPHPMEKPHIGTPSNVIQVDPSLPLSKAGDVTCTTCHDPHYDPKGRPKRLRVDEAASICNMCHWK